MRNDTPFLTSNYAVSLLILPLNRSRNECRCTGTGSEARDTCSLESKSLQHPSWLTPLSILSMNANVNSNVDGVVGSTTLLLFLVIAVVDVASTQ